MFFRCLHLETHTRRLSARSSAIAGLAGLALALTGCQGIAGTSVYTQVRFIDASPDAGGVSGLDFYQNSTGVLYNVGFGGFSSYIPTTPGGYSYSVDTVGTQQQLATVRGTVTAGAEFTVLTGDVAASLQMTVLRDQSSPAPSGQIALRFLDQATRVGAVDIYLLPSGGTLSSVSPVATGILFDNTPQYINAPSGTYTIVILPSGTIPSGTTSALYTGTQISYPGSSVRTILLIDQQLITSPGLQVKVLEDYDPAASS
jgi:hypothetical protein